MYDQKYFADTYKVCLRRCTMFFPFFELHASRIIFNNYDRLYDAILDSLHIHFRSLFAFVPFARRQEILRKMWGKPTMDFFPQLLRGVLQRIKLKCGETNFVEIPFKCLVCVWGELNIE